MWLMYASVRVQKCAKVMLCGNQCLHFLFGKDTPQLLCAHIGRKYVISLLVPNMTLDPAV